MYFTIIRLLKRTVLYEPQLNSPTPLSKLLLGRKVRPPKAELLIHQLSITSVFHMLLLIHFPMADIYCTNRNHKQSHVAHQSSKDRRGYLCLECLVPFPLRLMLGREDHYQYSDTQCAPKFCRELLTPSFGT